MIFKKKLLLFFILNAAFSFTNETKNEEEKTKKSPQEKIKYIIDNKIFLPHQASSSTELAVGYIYGENQKNERYLRVGVNMPKASADETQPLISAVSLGWGFKY